MTEPSGRGSSASSPDLAGEADGSRDPRALLERAGVRGDPRHDQHFLVDGRVLDRIVGYAGSFDRTHVLEIGAGTGGLTDRLLRVAERVTAIERDRTLAGHLREVFAKAVTVNRLAVIQGDALSVSWPAFTVAVSNLPYSISSELLFRLLPRGRPLVLLVQREFADRLTADAGTMDYGRLSVTAGHYAAIEQLEVVPPSVFEPKPPVEGAIVRARPRTPPYEVPDDDRFMAFVTAVFTQRRKTMRNAIRNTAHISGLLDPDDLVDAADPGRMNARPEQLEPAEFAALVQLAESMNGWSG